ncbi:MAG TPA: Clp protease N-terminal domain-containing protein, partial [Gemmatimonadales bacterium]|nr:Clp protease N-terminal domain-containing protein [Gemmatimonadales bacterium]
MTRVVETARRAAAAAQHAFVGTEHLLAALLVDETGSAAHALRAAGVSLDGLAEELLTGLPRAEAGGAGPPPLSRFAERAIAEAEKSGADLATVLLRAPRGRIATVLGRRGAKLNELRKQLDGHRAKEPKAPGRNAAKQPGLTARPLERPPDLAARRLPPHLETRKPRARRRIPWALLLLLAVPASVLLRWQQVSPLLIFFTACLGVLPLARLLGQATEQLAERTGPTVGGLLNATFGNAAELIIALVALRAGLVDLVKASITGSILGNLLLILGLALVAGGVTRPTLTFNRTAAGMSGAMLLLAVVGLVVPALFAV